LLFIPASVPKNPGSKKNKKRKKKSRRLEKKFGEENRGKKKKEKKNGDVKKMRKIKNKARCESNLIRIRFCLKK